MSEIINGVASEYEYPNDTKPIYQNEAGAVNAVNDASGYSRVITKDEADAIMRRYSPDERKEDAKYEYAARNYRNKEYYKDPTHHNVANKDGYSGRPRDYHKSDSAPVYIPRRSKRYEVIGMIMRLVDLAGFELAERVVLRDKVTGEVLK